MTQSRNVTRGDFENIYRVWDAYRSGKFSRSEMTPLSQLSHPLNLIPQ
jgi:hypothetical protein